MVTPKLVVEPMKKWKERILIPICRLLRLKGYPTMVTIEFDDVEITVNDLYRMQQEDEMNTPKVDKETGE